MARAGTFQPVSCRPTTATRSRSPIFEFISTISVPFTKPLFRCINPGRLLAYGHSIGGHLIVLRWLAERQMTDVQAAILTAPMLAIGPRAHHAVAGALQRSDESLGWARIMRLASMITARRNGNSPAIRCRRILNVYAIIARMFDALSRYGVGGVSWGWLSAALRSMHACACRACIESMKTTGVGDDRKP